MSPGEIRDKLKNKARIPVLRLLSNKGLIKPLPDLGQICNERNILRHFQDRKEPVFHCFPEPKENILESLEEYLTE